MNRYAKLTSKLITRFNVARIGASDFAHLLFSQFGVYVLLSTLAASFRVGYGRKPIAGSNVFPIATASNHANVFAFHTKHIGKLLVGVLTGSIGSAYFSDLFFGEFRSADTLPTRPSLWMCFGAVENSALWAIASLGSAIGSVIGLCAEKQVSAIAAWRIVAGMTYKAFARINAVLQIERNAVRSNGSTANLKLAVASAIVRCCLPFPTFVRFAALDVKPKAGSVDSGDSRKGLCFSHDAAPDAIKRRSEHTFIISCRNSIINYSPVPSGYSGAF
jgi:hypothetical protein